MSAKRRAELAAAGIKAPGSTLLPKGALRVKFSAIGPDAARVEAVLERDCAACVVCGRPVNPEERGSAWSVHHRNRIRTDNRLSNLIVVCGGADVPGCHQEIHAEVATARRAGWLVSQYGITSEWVMATWQYGWVHLLDDGDVIEGQASEVSHADAR
jgi:hypothetical protein